MAGKQTVGVGSPWSGEFPERKTRLFSGPDNPAFSRLFDVFRGQRIDRRGAYARGCPARAQNPNLKVAAFTWAGQNSMSLWFTADQLGRSRGRY